MTESKREQPSVHVALVHGTWARNAAWTRTGSLLVSMLGGMRGRDVAVTTPGWSGKNSEKDRWAATESLKGELQAADADLKVVVGHSHGGNIGAQALHSPEAATGGVGEQALVTLNTPFVVPTRRSIQVTILHTVLLCVALAVCINLVIDRHLGGVAAAFSPVLAIFGAALIAAGLLWGVPGAYSLFRLKPKEAPWLMRLVGRPGTDTKTRVLCVATADDEALGWLQFTEMMLNLPFLMLHRIALPVVLLVIALGHFVMEWDFTDYALADFAFLTYIRDVPDVSPAQFLGAYWLRPPLGDAVDPATVASVSRAIWDSGNGPLIAWLSLTSIVARFLQFWSVLAVVGLVGTYLLGAIAFGTGLGYRSFVSIFFVRMRISSVPIGFSHVEFMEVDPDTSGWLRHSDAYNDPKVSAAVAYWVGNLPAAQVSDDAWSGP